MASLTALIEAGLVKPGRGSLQLTYKGTAFEADVLADGRVQSGAQRPRRGRHSLSRTPRLPSPASLLANPTRPS